MQVRAAAALGQPWALEMQVVLSLLALLVQKYKY
jgi:hypothetical protein